MGKIRVQGQAKIIPTNKPGWWRAQVAGRLPSNHEVLSSNPSTLKKVSKFKKNNNEEIIPNAHNLFQRIQQKETFPNI
jgi:hypothetical protein